MNGTAIAACAVVAMFVVIILVILVVFGLVIRRLIEDHCLANKYRELVRLASLQPPPSNTPRGAWTISYRYNRKTYVDYADGRTEGEAIANFMRSTKYDVLLGISPTT